MNGYMYQADLWCEACGLAIRAQCHKYGNAPADPDDEHSYDSDEYPKSVDVSGEADSPQHCGAGAECVNALELDSGRKIGVWLGNTLTGEGIRHVKELIDDRSSDVTEYWQQVYADALSKGGAV